MLKSLNFMITTQILTIIITSYWLLNQYEISTNYINIYKINNWFVNNQQKCVHLLKFKEA